MDQATHAKGQHILARLCPGRAIAGIHFVAEPVLTLGLYSAPDHRVVQGPAEVYLHIEAGCTIVGPSAPSGGSPSGTLSLATLAQTAVALRGVPIVEARLACPSPHLDLHFADGTALRVEGHDLRYEPWSIAAGEWSLYALANDEITWGVPHPAFADDAA